MIHNSILNKQRIARIESIIHADVGRNAHDMLHATCGGLVRAAQSLQASPVRVAIVTGFFIPDADPPAAETDGLLGAVQLAAALHLAQIPVVLITDDFCVSALKALSLAACPKIETFHVHHADDALKDLHAFLKNDFAATHLVSIERAGPAADKNVYNMRGENISQCTAPLHLLFTQSSMYKTIAIGDGGNEIGMGNLELNVLKSISHAEKIHCSVPCDYLIGSGVSNWGAFALAAAFGMLSQQPSKFWQLLHSFLTIDLLRVLVNNGPAVDGVTGKSTLSVDGLSWQQHAAVMRAILALSYQVKK